MVFVSVGVARRIPAVLRLVLGVLVLSAGCGDDASDPPPVARETVAHAGNVLDVAGKVTATRGGATRALAKADAVYADDVIETAADGSVMIEFAHNRARWSIDGGLKRRVDESAAWGLAMQTAPAKPVEHATSAAGRHAEKSAADTKETVVGTEPPNPTITRPQHGQNQTGAGGGGGGGGGKNGAAEKHPRDPAKDPGRRPRDKKDTGGKHSGDCDEVSCLLSESPSPCCRKLKKQTKDPKDEAKKPAGDLPETLGKTEISAGIGTVKSKVLACGDKHGAKGTVRARLVVGADGNVTSVTVEQTPDADLGSCVAAALRQAKFARSQTGGRFTYPFVF